MIQQSKEFQECPLMSPFGILANTSTAEFSNQNNLTIVSKVPDLKEPASDGINLVFQGKGNLTKEKKQSRIKDHTAQLEFKITTKKTLICTNHTAYPGIGLPDTYIDILDVTKRQKRSLVDDPSGFLILASDPNRGLAYMPRSEKFTVPPCIFDDRASAEEQYHKAVNSG